MKKQFIALALGLFLNVGSIYAERGPLVMKLPYTCLQYNALHLSPNGKWACGVIDNGTYSGWIWNLTTGQLTELTQVGVSSTAWQVANDGTVAGTFLRTDATDNGAEVEASGYWRKGHWYPLQMKGNDEVLTYDHAAQANSISDDGRYIGGQALVGGEYVGVVWDMQDGGKVKVLPNNDAVGKNKGGSIFTVTNQGYAAGWTYAQRPNSDVINRTAALWVPDLKMPEPQKVEFYYSARISPSGKYAIVNSSIYNVQTGELKPINGVWDYDFYSINDEGVAVGMYQASMESRATGCIVIDGKIQDINAYLRSRGVDLGHYSIAQVVAVSNDTKTFACMAYNTGASADQVLIDPIVVKLDEDLTTREPAGIDALVLEGANAVKLNWRKPLVGEEGVTAYEVYRDGSLVKSFDPAILTYTDLNVEQGNHKYTAVAVYGNERSQATEETEVTVSKKLVSAPRDAMALQARVNDVRLLWDAPESTLPSLRYFDGDEKVFGLGWGKYSIEAGTRFSADMLAAYGDEAKLEGLTFYPMSSQLSWIVSVYKASDTKKPLYAKTVENNDLHFGTSNTVKFDTPVAIPAGEDLILSVTAMHDPTSDNNYNVIGRVTGKKQIGYTDLMRRVGVDKEFFSMYEMSMSREDNEAEDNTTWPIGLLISNATTADSKVDCYKIYENAVEVGTSTDCSTTVSGVTDGRHIYGVKAIYNDGGESPLTEVDVDIKANLELYNSLGLKAVAEAGKISLSWNAPAADDKTDISYAKGNPVNALVGSEKYNYTYTVGAKYSGSMLKPYDGYAIKAIKFFPLCEAYYSATLTANGKVVAFKDIDDDEYTLGSWSTVQLKEPVILEPGAEYLLSIECFEPTPGEGPIGIDGHMSHTNAGDLYKQGDDDFRSLSVESEISGNWMIGMVIGTPESVSLPVNGYNVRVGGSQTSETLLTEVPISETAYSYVDPAYGNYTFRVSPVCAAPLGELFGERVECKFDETAAVDEVSVDELKVYPNPATSYVMADGPDVKQIVAYNLSGVQVEEASGNRLDVSGLVPGVYLIKVKGDGRQLTTKVIVTK